MALNSLLLDPNRVWQGVWRWFDESMLDCCSPLDIVKLKGITLPKLRCLANCNGAKTELKFGDSISLEDFRNDVKTVCSASEEAPAAVMIVSYQRGTLKQSGSGHFSPIGSYHPLEDKVLIMDVARFKYPPHWVPLSLLYEALLPIDLDTGKSRGYLILTASDKIYVKCCCVVTEMMGRDDSDSSLPQADTATFENAEDHQARLQSILQHECPDCINSNNQCAPYNT
jgi:glutathione gamma-glutamylcysteinyltransferase